MKKLTCALAIASILFVSTTVFADGPGSGNGGTCKPGEQCGRLAAPVRNPFVVDAYLFIVSLW